LIFDGDTSGVPRFLFFPPSPIFAATPQLFPADHENHGLSRCGSSETPTKQRCAYRNAGSAPIQRVGTRLLDATKKAYKNKAVAPLRFFGIGSEKKQ
jgi:hypothetical protein